MRDYMKRFFNFFQKNSSIVIVMLLVVNFFYLIICCSVQQVITKQYCEIIYSNENLERNIKKLNRRINKHNANLLMFYNIPKPDIRKYDSEEVDQNDNKNKTDLICHLKTMVSPIDEIYYNYIITHNSYSHPLTEKEIWMIIDTLHKCKNDPKLILSIAFVESSFNKKAISKVGCIGLMQINPIHSKKYKFSKKDLFDPCKSILIADKLITDWKARHPKIGITGICKKYLGCHSKKYISKIMKNYNEINQELSLTT